MEMLRHGHTGTYYDVNRHFTCSYSYDVNPLCQKLWFGSKAPRSATPRVRCSVAWCVRAESGRRGWTQADFRSVERFTSHRADHQEGMFPFESSTLAQQDAALNVCALDGQCSAPGRCSHLTLDRPGGGGWGVHLHRKV